GRQRIVESARVRQWRGVPGLQGHDHRRRQMDKGWGEDGCVVMGRVAVTVDVLWAGGPVSLGDGTQAVVQGEAQLASRPVYLDVEPVARQSHVRRGEMGDEAVAHAELRGEGVARGDVSNQSAGVSAARAHYVKRAGRSIDLASSQPEPKQIHEMR